ncbi:MAG: primosomal protein N', partial [Magnetovibrio sp.]|nr:primosomal protein N' [Magnetovibrio sp.]
MTASNEAEATRTHPEFLGGDLVSVMLPLPLRASYDYRVPRGMRVRIGDFVLVPLSSRTQSGIVWGPAVNDISPNRIKEILRHHDCPPLTAVAMAFIEWVAHYVMHPVGGVLKMAMSATNALDPPKSSTGYTLANRSSKIRMTPERERVLNIAGMTSPQLAASLAQKARVSPSVVKGLAKIGALKTISIINVEKNYLLDPNHPGPKLTETQAEAAKKLIQAIESSKFSVTVLDGVPGAGKTEVYFEAISSAVLQGKQVLVLLPEIALSAQWTERFRGRFGSRPAEWHSDLSQNRRRIVWRAVAEGKIQVVVGARSALFLPFQNLGLIVVDEEHETAFKQEDGVIYNARDMAVVRAKLGNFSIALASATPSLETIVNVKRGRYDLLHLPARHGGAALPDVEIIDMIKFPAPHGRWLSSMLENRIRETLGAGEQALLFLNRRGYAPMTLCR